MRRETSIRPCLIFTEGHRWHGQSVESLSIQGKTIGMSATMITSVCCKEVHMRPSPSMNNNGMNKVAGLRVPSISSSRIGNHQGRSNNNIVC